MTTGRNDIGYYNKTDLNFQKYLSDEENRKKNTNSSRKNQGGSLRRRNSRKIKRRGGEEDRDPLITAPPKVIKVPSKAQKILGTVDGTVDDKAGKGENKGFFSFFKKPIQTAKN